VAVANLGFSASYLMVFAPTISQELPEMDVGSYGTAMGSIIAGYGVGGTVFSLLVGLVRDTTGSMHIAMFVLIASTQLALLALIPLRETGWRDSST
jgi:nitrate/nitrite transporter NarK